MQYVCDAGALTWFRLETEAEAAMESQLMEHAVARYFKEAYAAAMKSYQPPESVPAMEQNIGRKDHVARVMPRFMTLRDSEGTALVTAMLPPAAAASASGDVCPIIVGKANSNPYTDYGAAIAALSRHTGLDLDPDDCYPYRR